MHGCFKVDGWLGEGVGRGRKEEKGRTSTRLLRLCRYRNMHVAMVLTIQLGQMSDDGVGLARRKIGAAAWVANASFPTDGGRDGGFGGVEATIGYVGPSGCEMGR